MEMETKQDHKYTSAIRWVRAKMKAYYPRGGANMTAALNLWHILRDTSHRHGCGFDRIFYYHSTTRALLQSLLKEGLLEETDLESLWDAMIRQLKVSHTPHDASDYWKKFPTFKKKEGCVETPTFKKKEGCVETAGSRDLVVSKPSVKKRGFFSRLISRLGKFTVVGK